MRFSDIIAGAALIFTIIASLYFHHRSKKLGANLKSLSTQVKIQTLADKKRRRDTEPGAEPAPTYQGTFIVNDGQVELDTSYFHVRRRSHDEFIEVHVFAARFYEDRLKPVVEAGHKITATPVSGETFTQAVAEAEAVYVEFRDVTGRIFRSPELGLR
jgi:hypothetical protein